MEHDGDTRDEAELLRAAAADDAAAFARFYRRHVRGVIAFFHRRTGDAETAADLTAETFAAALAGCHRYDPDVAVALPALPDDRVALAAPPDDQRDAVRARVLDDRSYEEIAADQRISAPAARQRVSRGLAALRAHLKGIAP